ncbi:methyltransferase domain-containing protein [Ornithinibacillus sp. L9]|uniref:Methyltransferase domain-containing protein n=1 Tax=Ornithinibacillus caprae TaxID=2678566 RepID=A0A6N8FJB5_9BACI|nr:class I SAM-dependent methyltransferase [Ornithinibacillus caprae]MUK89503.1 methyltransferase domain-containing protein [Ornithinibacillus caprae]
MRIKDEVIQSFSKNREAYVTSSTHSKGKDLSQLIEWIQPKPNMMVLDIATGGGHVAKSVSEHVHTVFATDITKQMLETASKYLTNYDNIHYIVADAENLPFLDHTFDIVTCRIAAHHFPNPAKFMQETARVLKLGGVFLFIDNVAPEKEKYDTFINQLEKMRDYSHVRSLRISEWMKLFHKHQFTVVKQEKKKKTLPYTEWINRTLDSQKDKENVKNFMLHEANDIHSYFHIESNEEDIQSFTIDEWMVLCQKKQ